MRNKGRFINWQKTREINSHKKYSERSPYWEFMEKVGKRDESGSIIEYPLANPDVLADESEEEQNNNTRKIMLEIIKTVKFSKKEKAVLNLVALQNKTEDETAKILGITRSSVRIYLRRAQRKCEKEYVTKTRDSSVYGEQEENL